MSFIEILTFFLMFTVCGAMVYVAFFMESTEVEPEFKSCFDDEDDDNEK